MEQSDEIFSLPSKQLKIDSLDEKSTPDLYQFLTSNKLEKLHTLRLSGNSYSSEFFEKLSTYLSKAPCLKYCDFNDIFVQRKEDSIPLSLTSIMTGVMHLGNLEKIDLSNNAISKNGAEAIAPFLAKQNKLKVFLISNCGLGIAGVSVLADALKQGTPELEVLAIARNRVENDGALKLAEAIKNLPKLKEIHIYQNFIQEKGMHALMKSLQECKDLEIIDIRDNYLKKTAAEAFGELLTKAHKLKGINISDCNLEKEENDIVVKSLEASTLELKKIGYNYNELDNKNGKLLIDLILKNNNSIERFDIKGNDFGKETKKYYIAKMTEINSIAALSKFDSDDEDEQELIKTFSDLKI